jgi:3-oxoadipate enol-lactonase
MAHTASVVDVPGARLHVQVDGDAESPPLVLLHSAVVDMRSWDAMVPDLVNAGYRVIRYDIRGYGTSPTEDVEFSNQADLVAVLDALGVERAAVVGNSRGAMIAIDAILETPGRFVAFAWVGGGIGGFGDDLEPTPQELELFEAADAAERAGDADTLADLEVRIWLDGVGQPPTRVPAAIRDAMRAMDRPLLEPGRIMGRPVRLSPPADERLDELTLPILVVVGQLDTTDTRAAAARLATRAPSARLVAWPDVAHLVGMEQPARLAATIADFLAPLPRWR